MSKSFILSQVIKGVGINFLPAVFIGDKKTQFLLVSCQVLSLRWLTTVFRRLVARVMIACQTLVLITRAQMTQVTLRRNENHFST